MPKDLPPFNKITAPTFKWGSRDVVDFINDVDAAYLTIAKWRKNILKLPSGSAGKHFTQAKADLYSAYCAKVTHGVHCPQSRCHHGNI